MDSASGVLLIFLFTSATSLLNAHEIDEDNFNVMDYGATSDDLTDDSQAFLEAWDDACSASVESSRVYVPAEKTFVVDPITFHGPCYASTINFAKQCTTLAPTALKFVSCNESSVSNMKFTNSAQTHILVRGCNSFSIDNVMIESPGNSPNTDGIHIQSSQHVLITNSRIATGDDCVSIGDHTSNIEIENVECGPGHGISIGSLGRGGNYVQVQNILVTDAFFNGTTNGARIKTWQVGRGYVRDVTFQNLLFNHVQNPIIIDQNYCNVRNACKEQETGVQISNVNYKEVLGTSTTDIAININCSRSVPCFGISMESIQLLSAEVGKQVTANCSNAYGEEVDVVPGPCLLD
ncbi:probable polygalacturonase At2g43860 isoform X3 [Sesamum indicum]|uniref:Probable polygalacturonase At2g43860 isoform X3 n=1 Tax=Sesamum indicum TaxID=4182 RepID=A0A8M8UZA9_SESIN|nr:probable polygalacturonase At2g43860 isoform X3 [Sesamum indicum]